MLKIAVLATILAMVAATGAAAARMDPYKSYRYVLTMDGRPVAGAHRLRLRGGTGEVVKHRAGGDPGLNHKSPGRDKFEPVTLERGLTQDPEFAGWAASASAGRRRSLGITTFDPAGRPKASYRLSGCWTSRYHALPKLNDKGNAIAIEHLKLRCQGFTSLPRP